MFRIGAPAAGMTYARRLNRSVDELVGLCRGLLADGGVSREEVDYLQRWLACNREFAKEYPFRELYALLETALVDGVMDADEERDILAAVHQLAGNTVDPGHQPVPGVVSSSSRLPLCSPPPSLEFEGRAFVVTGTFDYGPRRQVVAAIAERGGVAKATVSRQVHYLVVGNIGARDWLHSSFGTKIKDAVALRDCGAPVAIVDEDHWLAHL